MRRVGGWVVFHVCPHTPQISIRFNPTARRDCLVAAVMVVTIAVRASLRPRQSQLIIAATS